jgi:hypothetical protein
VFKTILALILLLIAPISYAASGNTLSGSGSAPTSLEETTALQEERAGRTTDLRLLLMQFKKADAQYHEKLATFVRKRAENRTQCRADIRKANRDTKYPTIQRCYRGDLTLEREYLQEQRTYLEKLPGIRPSVRALTLDRLQLLQDAINTILFAVDSGVFKTEADLAEARKNLRTRYRTPFSESLITLRNDGLITFLSALIINVDKARDEERSILQADERTEWLQARMCLTQVEARARAPRTGSGDIQILLANLNDAATCVQSLQLIPKAVPPGTPAK